MDQPHTDVKIITSGPDTGYLYAWCNTCNKSVSSIQGTEAAAQLAAARHEITHNNENGITK